MILNHKFHHPRFCGVQEEALIWMMGNLDRNLLVVEGTSVGKSLIYQLPAILTRTGLTVVISATKSLIVDQVGSFNQRALGVVAHTTDDLLQNNRTELFTNIRQGRVRLLYLSPETLSNNSKLIDALQHFQSQGWKINRVVIDEAHMVYLWGTTIRSAYRDMTATLAQLDFPPLLLLTATSTYRFREYVKRELNLEDDDDEHQLHQIFGQVHRPNLYLSVEERRENLWNHGILMANMIANLWPGMSGLIYCQTVHHVKNVVKCLNQRGISNRPYYGELTTEDRQSAYHAWMSDECQVIVATSAFGLGVDKRNVRFVLHFSLPHTFDDYIQQCGRAGRDGKQAWCFAFWDMKADIKSIDESRKKENPFPSKEDLARWAGWNSDLDAYFRTRECRWLHISNYLDTRPSEQLAQPQEYCCDNCWPANKVSSSRSSSAASTGSVSSVRRGVSQMKLTGVGKRKMGKIWGNMAYIKNIAFHRVSPYELNPFANFWGKSYNGIKRDFTENGWFLIGLVGMPFFIIQWAEEQNRIAYRKQPGQFDSDK